MKRFLYILTFIVALSSCVKEFSGSIELPVSGKWASVDEDGFVSEYIEVTNGYFATYDLGAMCYYSDKVLYGVQNPKEVSNASYAVIEGQLWVNNQSYEVSFDDEELILDGKSYVKVAEVKSQKYSTVTVKTLPNNNVLTYDYSTRSVSLDYTLKCQSAKYPFGKKVEVVATSADWVETPVVTENKISFKLAENNSENPRKAKVIVSYPSAEDVVFYVEQGYSEPQVKLSAENKEAKYNGGDFSFTYNVENPRENTSVVVSCQEDWIKDLRHIGNKVSYTLPENNTGSARSGKIVLKYGDLAVLYSVIQTGETAEIKVNPSSLSCNYLGQNCKFTCEVENPRAGLSLNLSSEADWITGLEYKNNEVSFSISENVTGSPRKANIVLTYGELTLNYKVAQEAGTPKLVITQPSITCDYKGGSREFTYTIENERNGQSLQVACAADWIKNLKHEGKKVSFNIPVNTSGADRKAVIVLTYGGVSAECVVAQSYDAPVVTLGTSSVNCNYLSKSYTVDFSVSNTREGYTPQATCGANWITSLACNSTNVSFTVKENNTGATRTADVVVSYGPSSATFKVVQTADSPVITLTSSSMTCSYYGGSGEFSYGITNPRSSYSVQISQSSWITGVTTNNKKISFTVPENNTGAARTGTIKVTYGPATATFTVTQTYDSPIITLSNTSTSFNYLAGNGEFTYAISNPRDGSWVQCSSNVSWITNVVVSEGKVTYAVQANESKNSRSGSITLSYAAGAGATYTVSQSGIQTLSENGTANCYIVSAAGDYRFKAVQGNSTTSVGTVGSVAVLWESYGTSTTPSVGSLVKSVSYDNGYVYITTADTFKEGNAVIAAKNSSGTILWSWHIWLTDQPQEQVYYNNAGTMMDRNLGATATTKGSVYSLGLLYQWGRKDPFLGSSSISSNSKAASTITWPSAVTSSSSNGTIDYAVQHPTTFISYNSSYSYYDWYHGSDNARWGVSKTKYDPCPPGWKVPSGGSSGVWAKAYGSSSSFTKTYDSTNKGTDFSGYFGSASSIWYPDAGYLYYSGGSLSSVGSYGYYWSSTKSGTSAYRLYMSTSSTSVNPVSYTYPAYGCSVRCVKE